MLKKKSLFSKKKKYFHVLELKFPANRKKTNPWNVLLQTPNIFETG